MTNPMKSIAKLSLLALAAALTASASADTPTLVTTSNGHGGFRYHYRAAESPTIAVMAGGRTVGQPMACCASGLRLETRQTGRGQARQQYVAVK